MTQGVRRPLGDDSAMRRLWQAALALTAFAATGVFLLLPFVDASYEGRLERDAGRAPIVVDEDDRSTAVALSSTTSEHLDFQYVDIRTVAVLDESAPPPPGLAAWPEPGGVYASQALLDLAGSASFLARYGEVRGVIDPTGLTDRGERFVYVGAEPEAMAEKGWLIAGFGSGRINQTLPGAADVGYTGAALRHQWRMNFWVGLVAFGVAPVLIMTVVSARLGGESRDRRLAVLAVVGAGRLKRAGYLLRETWCPIGLGAVGATALGALATTTSWRLPFAGYVVEGSDLRPILPWIPVVAAGGAVVVFAAVFLAHRIRRHAAFGSRPVPKPRRVAIWPLGLLAVVVPATYYGYIHFRFTRPDLSSIIAISGSAASVLLIGSATSALILLAAHGMTALSKRRSLPTMLVAGRDLASMSRPVVRATIAVSVAIVLATQVQVWMSVADASFRDAKAQDQLNQDRSLSIPPAKEVEDIIDELPPSIAPLALSSGFNSNQVIWGDCTAIESVLDTCPSTPTRFAALTPRLPQAQLWIEPDAVILEAPITYDPPDVDGTDPAVEVSFDKLLLFSTDQRPLSRDRLAQQVHEHHPLPLTVAGPGDSWLTGAMTDRDQGRWFGYGGVLALTIVFLTAGFSLVFEMVRISRRFAPLSVLVDASSRYYALAAGVVGLPMMAAAASGMVVATTIVLGPTTPGEGGIMPTGLLVTLGAVSVTAAVAMTFVSGGVTSQAARNWFTGREE